MPWSLTNSNKSISEFFFNIVAQRTMSIVPKTEQFVWCVSTESWYTRLLRMLKTHKHDIASNLVGKEGRKIFTSLIFGPSQCFWICPLFSPLDSLWLFSCAKNHQKHCQKLLPGFGFLYYNNRVHISPLAFTMAMEVHQLSFKMSCRRRASVVRTKITSRLGLHGWHHHPDLNCCMYQTSAGKATYQYKTGWI